MRRNSCISTVSVLAAALGVGGFVACGAEESDEWSAEQRLAALKACRLDDGTVEHHAEARACPAGSTKKTTICHVPPGNPANAHTLCIGNAAVKAHLRNHPDYLGPCKDETPCPPPAPPAGTGGTPPQPPSEGTGGTMNP